jgi:hypothetical protein
MSVGSDIDPILALLDRVDAAKPARFSYTQTAFDSNIIEGVDSFSLSNDQNIPNNTKTDYDTTVLDRGARTQGASIPRMAWDHFIGRFSYNLAKLTQQTIAFFKAEKKMWAHNAFEYDASQKYLTGDVCYVIGAVNGVTTVEFYKRTSVTPLELTGISPVAVGQSDWAPVEYRTNLFPLLPISSEGYRHRYSVIDLTGGEYNSGLWYPVTTEAFPAAAPLGLEEANTLQVMLEAYVVGTVAGNANPCRAEMTVMARFTGSATSSAAAILNNSFIQTNDGADLGVSNSPIGYSVLPKGQQAVTWLRGGSRYALWNSYGADYTVRTTSYSNPAGDPAVTPGARVFTYNPVKIWAKFSTPDATATDEVVNLGQVNGSLPLPLQLSNGQDLNTITNTGSYYTANATIANGVVNVPIPNPGVFHLLVSGNRWALDGGIIFVQQFTQRSTGDVYTRTMQGTTVIVGWTKLWSSGNMGAGSGLNADMVDGMHIGQSGVNYIPYANASGNVLIGTTTDSALGLVQLYKASTDVYLEVKRGSQTGLFGSTGTAGIILSAEGATDLNFFTNTVGRMRITSGGNVLIGKTDQVSTDARLQVASALSKSTTYTGTIAYFGSSEPAASSLNLAIRQGGNAVSSSRFMGIGVYEEGYGARALTLQADGGNVLIGTTIDYGGRVTIVGAGSTAETWALYIRNSNLTKNLLLTYDDGSGEIFGGAIQADVTGSIKIGTSLSPRGSKLVVAGGSLSSVPAIGSATGASLFQSYNPSSTDFGIISGTLLSGKGYLQVQDTNGGVSSYPLLLQPNGGNVLIGTTVNSSKLTIQSSVSSPTSGGLTNISALTGSVRILGSLGSAAEDGISYSSFGGGSAITFGRGASYDTQLYFYTNAATNNVIGGMTERMRITSGGNVLIGTTTDGGQPLQVKGSNGAILSFTDTASSAILAVTSAGEFQIKTGAGQQIGFYPSASASRAMQIGANGNVYIGESGGQVSMGSGAPNRGFITLSGTRNAASLSIETLTLPFSDIVLDIRFGSNKSLSVRGNGVVSLQRETDDGTGAILQVNGGISGTGANITGLNASNLASGTVPSSRVTATSFIDLGTQGSDFTVSSLGSVGQSGVMLVNISAQLTITIPSGHTLQTFGSSGYFAEGSGGGTILVPTGRRIIHIVRWG